ncbi:MAG: hypothetical protein IPL46_08455 [Saprospiraceae bacterium]|nr:hypothetical protein [Saprospiraceae bacterium]
MKWIKKGLIYNVEGSWDWAVSHCHKPTPLVIDENTVRAFFGVRDRKNITRTTFVDIDVSDVYNVYVKYIHDRPVLDVGKLGAFDDCGANVSSLVRLPDGRVYMYFIGWNPSTTVHTRNAIGLAESNDHGFTFRRLYDGSVLDRNKDEPYYTGAVDVSLIGDKFKMWYTSGREWKLIDGKPEICYHIKFAESKDGIDWIRENIDCILPEDLYEAVARPSVMYDKDRYRMWFSKRRIDSFRNNQSKGYRGGYAESKDGIIWNRMDQEFGLELSSGSEWDSKAIAYPYVVIIKGHYFMLYNGNDFGRSGFGYAISK